MQNVVTKASPMKAAPHFAFWGSRQWFRRLLERWHLSNRERKVILGRSPSPGKGVEEGKGLQAVGGAWGLREEGALPVPRNCVLLQRGRSATAA